MNEAVIFAFNRLFLLTLFNGHNVFIQTIPGAEKQKASRVKQLCDRWNIHQIQ